MAKNVDKVWAAFDRFTDDDGLSSPTIGELVGATGLSPSTIQRATRALVLDGRLRQVSAGGGRGAPSYYEVFPNGFAPIVENPPAPLRLVETVSETVSKPSQKGVKKPSQMASTGEDDPRVTQPPRGVGYSRSGQTPVDETPNAVKNPRTHEGASYPNDYLRCECGKPKLAGDAECGWCHRRYPFVSERPEWHPAQGPRDENGDLPPAVAANLEAMRNALRRASQRNRFRRWDKK